MTVARLRAVHDVPRPLGHEYEAGVAFGTVLDARAPLFTPAGAAPLESVVYGTAGPGGRDLDLWLHRRADRGERAPGIVFVHGGGWAGGAPNMHGRHAHVMAQRGWVTASLTYRLSPEAPWPACLDDVQRAIRWLRENAGDLGLDPSRIAVAGGSAGGHLALMAALTTDVQAAIAWYPAVDMRAPAIRPFVDALMPGASDADLVAASPIGILHDDAPPILTMTGDADALTVAADIERFHDALDERGAEHELIVFRDRDHGFDFHPQDWLVCVERMTEFLDHALARTGA